MRHTETISVKADWPRSSHTGPDTRLVHQILISADPIETLGQILNDLSNASRLSTAAVYRVSPHRAAGDSLGLTLDRDLTPTSPRISNSDLFGADALDAWAEELLQGNPILARTAELPRDERHRIAEIGCRSFLASPVMSGGDPFAVLIYLSEAEVDDWPDDSRAICELASDAIGVAVLHKRAVLHDRLEAVLAYSFDIIAVVGPDATIVYYTPRLARILGDPDEELIGTSALNLVHPQDQSRVTEALQNLLDHPEGQRRIEARLKHVDGSWRHFEVLATNQIDNPLIQGIVVTAYDVTNRKNLERRLNWQALHDPLTKLANRALLLNDLRYALARAQRTGSLVGLLYLDLDRFKDINDRFGHPAGDQLLVRIGERLRACVRADETVARPGGDEFVVLLEGLAADTDVERAAARILDAVRLPVRLDRGVVTITTSIGFSIANGETVEPDDLLNQADTALYEAKRAGRACHQRYTAERQSEGAMPTKDSHPRLG